MTYELVFQKDALKRIEGLETKIRMRVIARLTIAQENPHHFFERLKSHTAYKLRIGDYRIIADIDDTEQLIVVSNIGLRSKICDDL